MGQAQRRLADTLAKQPTKQIERRVHGHRHGVVARVSTAEPKCDVVLDSGREVQGVDFSGSPPVVGDHVELLVQPDHGMRVIGGRSNATPTTVVIAPPTSTPPPQVPFSVNLSRLTIFGDSWCDSLLPTDVPVEDLVPPDAPSPPFIEEV
jgi:hypothetical protein